MINESFLINDDTLNILKLKFIKIEKLSNINDEKNLALMFINIIRTNKTNKNDEKNLFIETLETDEDEANKNDQRQKYLSLSTLFLSMLLFLSTSSSLRNEHQKKRSIKNAKNKSFLNIADILFEDFSRVRKSTRKTIYYSTLNEAFIKSKKIFHTIFSASLIIVVLKDIKLHRDNLLSKSKYYKKIIKYSLASEFLQIIFTKIKIFQSKEI